MIPEAASPTQRSAPAIARANRGARHRSEHVYPARSAMLRTGRLPLPRRALALAGAILALGVALAAPPAGAQVPQDASRGGLLIDQRSAEFAQQLRQSQQAHEIERASGGNPAVRREMEMLHLQQRHRQENLHSRQLQEYEAAGGRAAQSDGVAGPAPLPSDIARFQRERAAQALRHGYELDELERSTKARPKEEVPRWGPTLTDPR